MEIEINKEVFDYKETVFFGLTMRQLVFSVLAIGSAVGIYFLLNERIGKEITSWICLACAVPFAFFGFFRYNGMYAGMFLISVFRCELLFAGKRVRLAEHPYHSLLLEIGNNKERGRKIESNVAGLLKFGKAKSTKQAERPPDGTADDSGSGDL